MRRVFNWRSIPAFLVICIISGHNPAFAQQNLCADLRNQLASIPSAGGGNSLAQQQLNEINKARGDFSRLRCNAPDTTNNAQKLSSCETIIASLNDMEQNYTRLTRRNGADPYSARREQILAQIAASGCDRPQPMQQQNSFSDNRGQFAQQPSAPAPNQNSEGDFLSWLFGKITPNRNSGQLQNQLPIEPNLDPNAPRIGGAIRTVCVRTCDGYYWPVTYSTSQNAFNRDESICEQMCPTQTTQLFYHYVPGQWSEDMVNLQGVPYKSMSYAFAYREKFNAECACRVLKQPETAEKISIDNSFSTPKTKLEFPLAIKPAISIEKSNSAIIIQPITNEALKPLEISPQNPFLPLTSETPHRGYTIRSPENLRVSVQSGGNSSTQYNAPALTAVPKAP